MTKDEKLKFAINALRKIVNPLPFIYKDLEKGEVLDGIRALLVVNSSSYLKGLAGEALKTLGIKDD